MNVNFNIGQRNITNIHRINQSTNQSSVARNGNGGSEQLSKAEHKDSVTISLGGKRNSLLERLMKQKANITDQKNSLISSTIEKGATLDTIKSQLENYDEQMKSVDEQIAELTAKEMKKQTEELKEKEDSAPKTEEEIQNERLANLTSLSSDLKQAEVVHSVQTKVDGDARVLKSEIAMDQSYASTQGAKEAIVKKEATLAKMQEKALDLTSQIIEKISDIIEKTDDSNKPQEIEPPKETKADEANSTDKVNLTDEVNSTDKVNLTDEVNSTDKVNLTDKQFEHHKSESH